MAERDDFREETKRVLFERVGGICSHPACQATTSGPSTDPERSVRIGVAAHITAASEGGPRFDGTLSPASRRSAANGIWLCQNHAKEIDSDVQKHTVAILENWKSMAEKRAEERLGRPLAAVAGGGPAHRADIAAEQLQLARINAPDQNLLHQRVGVGLYGMTIVNHSDRPLTLKEVALKYSVGGKEFETNSYVIRTGLAVRNEKAIETALLVIDRVRVFMAHWHNLRPRLGRRVAIGPGAVLGGSAFFLFEFKEWREILNVSNLKLVVRDYSGQETFHPFEMPREEPWPPLEAVFVNKGFTKHFEKDIEFDDTDGEDLSCCGGVRV